MASVPIKLQPSVQQIANLIPAVQRCPKHNEYLLLPWFGMFACCLYETLQQIAETNEGSAGAIAREAIRPTEGISEKGMPKLWRDR